MPAPPPPALPPLGYSYEMGEKGSVQLRFFFDEIPYVVGAGVGYVETNLFSDGPCNN